MEANLAAIVGSATPDHTQREALSEAAAATGSSGGPEQRAAVAAFAKPLVATLTLMAGQHCTAAGAPHGRDIGSNERSNLELLLRVLRNACAEPCTAEALVEGDLAPQVAVALSSLAAQYESLPACGELQAAAQLLVNWASSCGEGARERLWAALFPALLVALSGVAEPLVQGPLCLSLAAFCRSSCARCAALSEPLPAALPSPRTVPLCTLLDAAATGAGGGEDLARLMGIMVFSHGQLEHMVHACDAESLRCAPGVAAAAQIDFTLELFQELSDSIPLCLSGTLDFSVGEPGRASLVFLLDFIKENARTAAKDSSGGGQAVDRLRAGLQLLRAISSTDHDGLVSSEAQLRDAAGVLCQIGAVDLLLSLLKALPAVVPAGAAATRAAAGPTASSSGGGNEPPQTTLEPCPQLAEEARTLPATNVFQGYRSYLVAVIGNMAFKRPKVQTMVTERGGVELVLAQCQVEDASPMLREWGLWAIRNLTEGNEPAQQRIRELEVCQTLDSPELQAMGKQLEYDRVSGKMKVVARQQPQCDH